MRPLIVLAITGSIAAVRSFDLCRELCRRGFDVQVVMSGAGTEMITPQAMEFASGREVITRIGGKIEHVKFFGKNGKASLLLIAPATANTISKIAMGIDDTAVTTFATVAIGSKRPVLLAPAMHRPMYEHPIVIENLEKLRSKGVRVISPLEEEGKAKIACIEEIIFEAERALSHKSFAGKKELIASGAFGEKIDDIRHITNTSTGKLGAELARRLGVEGAQVKFIGNGPVESGIDAIEEHYADGLERKVMAELESGYGFFFCPAAIPDFSVKKSIGKASSSKKISIDLIPREKLIGKVRKKFPRLRIVAFKAVWKKRRNEMEKICREFVKNSGLLAVAAIDLSKFTPDAAEREMLFYSAGKKKILKGTKEKIAREIIELCSRQKN